MLRVLGLVVSIGLVDSLNPSTIGPALYLASEQKRTGVLQFTLAIFVIFFLGGLLLLLGPGQALLSVIPHPGHTIRYIGETVIGVLMVLAAPLLWSRRHRLRDRDHDDEPPKRRSALLLGATIAIVELPTAFPYFAAVLAIVESGLGVPGQVALVLIYDLCFVLPLIAIAVILTGAGDEAERVLFQIRDFFRAHWPELAAGLALVGGVFVTLLGVTGLLSTGHTRVGRFSKRLRRHIPH